MKNLLLASLFVFTTSFAFAQSLPENLGLTMRAMSTDLKTITAQSANASLNESSAALADQLAELSLHAKNFVPEQLAAMPEAQRSAAVAQYNSLLDQTANLAHQLAAAFRANDNAAAAAILKQLNQTKHDGHDQFKQD